MKFRVETKPKAEGFSWYERERVQVNAPSDRDGRLKVEAWAKEKYPTLEIWVSRCPEYFHTDKILD